MNIDIDEVSEKLNFYEEDIPPGLSISTITMSCTIGTEIYIRNIEKYMELDKKSIVSIKYNKKMEDGSVIRMERTLLKKKKQKRNTKTNKNRKKKKKQDVVNQVTMEIEHGSKKPASIKLFANGSIHIAGAKNIKDFFYLMNIVINALNRKVFILKEKYIEGKKFKIVRVIKEKKFYNDENEINISKIVIALINSGFKIQDTLINREKLYTILNESKDEEGSVIQCCQYEPSSHAGVRIKIISDSESSDNEKKKKKTTIIVFESGNILITGANNTEHLKNAYEFIVNKIETNAEEVIMIKIDNCDN